MLPPVNFVLARRYGRRFNSKHSLRHKHFRGGTPVFAIFFFTLHSNRFHRPAAKIATHEALVLNFESRLEALQNSLFFFFQFSKDDWLRLGSTTLVCSFCWTLTTTSDSQHSRRRLTAVLSLFMIINAGLGGFKRTRSIKVLCLSWKSVGLSGT